ncbi:MAG TPA: trypsin-like peptidase domain-containing protein [Candidatus Angelobacter sp.]
MRTWQRLFLGGIVSLAISALVAAPLQNNRSEIQPSARSATPQGSSLKTGKAAVTRSLAKHASQSDSGNLALEEAAVVKVLVTRADGTGDTATGLFVGTQGKNAYFITALHAISEDPDSLDVVLVHNIQIQFRHSQSFPAFPETKYDQVLDMGVVRTAATNLPRNVPKIPRKDAEVGVQFHIIGNPAGDWSVWSGNIQKNAVGDDPRRFRTNTDTSLVGGYSGGPVFDYDGSFLGMHTSTKASYGIAAKSREIVERLEAWGIPTDNFTMPTTAAPTAPGPAPLVSPEAEINKVIDAYEDAFRDKDAAALWRIWPNPPEKTKMDVQNSFKALESITREVTDRRVVIASDGTSATVRGQYLQQYAAKNESPEKSHGSMTFSLAKHGNSWVIDSIK